jgi:hypothetical protein
VPFIACFDGLYQDAVNIKALVAAVFNSFGAGDNPAVRFLGTAFNPVVVGVIMGNKDNISRQVITFAFIWVDVNNTPIVCGQAQAAVSLKKQFWHNE